VRARASELDIDMMPTSYVFKAGNRIRLAISRSQGRNYDLKKQGNPNTPTSVSTYRNKTLVSFVALPVVTKPIGKGFDLDLRHGS
jgi:predicted acyl esterase